MAEQILLLPWSLLHFTEVTFVPQISRLGVLQNSGRFFHPHIYDWVLHVFLVWVLNIFVFLLLRQIFDKFKAPVTAVVIAMVSLVLYWFLCSITEIILKSFFLWNFLFWQVDEDREGQIVDRTLVKNVLDVYIELGQDPATDSGLKLYSQDFQDAFQQGTIDYYSKKAQTWIVEDTCPEYMLKVTEELLEIPFHCVRSSSDSLFHRLRNVYKKRRNGLHIICILLLNRYLWRFVSGC